MSNTHVIAETFARHANSAGFVVMTPHQIEQEVFSSNLIEKGAEVMLLDWMSDAEIGETLFIVLHHLDKVRAAVRQLMQGPHGEKLHNAAADEAFVNITLARRMLAAHLKWADEVCVREGRPALADYEKGALETDGDTAAV